IVGRHEQMVFRRGRNRTASRTDSGIDDNDMNCSGRKIVIGGVDHESRFEDIVRTDIVRDIYDLQVRRNAQNYALHDSDEWVCQAEVGCERYNVWHAARLPR